MGTLKNNTVINGDTLTPLEHFNVEDTQATIQKYKTLGFQDVGVDVDGDIIVFRYSENA